MQDAAPVRPPRSRVDSVVARASAEWHAERQALTAKVEDIEQWASSRVGTVVALEEEVGVGVGSVDGHDSSCRHKHERRALLWCRLPPLCILWVYPRPTWQFQALSVLVAGVVGSVKKHTSTRVAARR